MPPRLTDEQVLHELNRDTSDEEVAMETAYDMLYAAGRKPGPDGQWSEEDMAWLLEQLREDDVTDASSS